MRKGFYHHIHGDQLHDLAIYFLQYEIVKKGGILQEPSIYKKKMYWPCEPDIIFTIVEKGVRYIHVIEVETDATKASLEKKTNQYVLSTAGVNLTIINLAEADADTQTNWIKFSKWLSKHLPI